ncbi:hypothetical protein D3C84_496430 [compost metagenome]
MPECTARLLPEFIRVSQYIIHRIRTGPGRICTRSGTGLQCSKHLPTRTWVGGQPSSSRQDIGIEHITKYQVVSRATQDAVIACIIKLSLRIEVGKHTRQLLTGGDVAGDIRVDGRQFALDLVENIQRRTAHIDTDSLNLSEGRLEQSDFTYPVVIRVARRVVRAQDMSNCRTGSAIGHGIVEVG